MSKTPQFDAALDEYFSKLELDKSGGQWRTCRFSGEKFYVRPEDIVFYKRIRVPLPALAPKERMRRKLAFPNAYMLFKAKSAYSGKEIISQFPPNTPFKVYEHEIWFGDGWDPFHYGVSCDSAQSFFRQFRDLQREVPWPNLAVDSTSVGSDYTNSSSRLKNCYLVFDSLEAENCSYSSWLRGARDCLDCFALFNSQECYEGFESSDLYRCSYIEYSRSCLDSYFLYDCRDCEHCFGCTNLRHKKYHFFNEPLTREAYEQELKKLNLGDRETVQMIKARFEALKAKAIRKETRNERSIVSFGNYIRDSKDCFACFYMHQCEHMAYSLGGTKNRDSCDVIGGIGVESTYDTYGGIQNQRISFSYGCKASHTVEYCVLCANCHDCFGCIGLRNKSFCILNCQYTEKEYWEKLDEIKTKMLAAGEHGEFFPPELALVPYSISVANSYKGYDDLALAARYGYVVEDAPETLYEISGKMMFPVDVPRDISDVSDDIVNAVIVDEKNKKKFRYTTAELAFYRRYRIPLPLEHFSMRLAEKRKRFGPILFELFDRICAKCGKKIQAAYAPDRPEIVYCEQCYNAEVV